MLLVERFLAGDTSRQRSKQHLYTWVHCFEETHTYAQPPYTGDVLHLFNVIPNVAAQDTAGATLAGVGEYMINVAPSPASQIDQDRQQVGAGYCAVNSCPTCAVRSATKRISCFSWGRHLSCFPVMVWKHSHDTVPKK
jgi:hypothetical protein